MFTEDQVTKAIAELKNPDVASWELFSEVPNFKVYRRAVTGSALKEYKVLGGFPDLPARYLLRAYTDLDLRMKWDKHMVSWKELPDHRLHFVAKFPWPLSPRDYVYELRVQEFAGGVYGINGKSVEDEAVPAKSSVVRVDEFRQDVLIQPTEDDSGCFLNALKDAGLNLMKKDAEAAQNEKAQPMSVNKASVAVFN
ncbi:hypothetical protein BGZ93_011185 [Podila epicladia]|nr:hypothetical protein BGZ93_011185 [Podila epicladia]